MALSLPVCSRGTRLPPLLPASPSVRGRLCWPSTPLLSTWPPNTSLGTALITSGSHSSTSWGQGHSISAHGPTPSPGSRLRPRVPRLRRLSSVCPHPGHRCCFQRDFTPGPVFWILLDYSPLLPELHSHLKPQFPEQESGGALRPLPPPAHVAAPCDPMVSRAVSQLLTDASQAMQVLSPGMRVAVYF